MKKYNLVEKDHGQEEIIFAGTHAEIVAFLKENEGIMTWVQDDDPQAEIPNLENAYSINDLKVELEKINVDWWKLEIKDN